MNIAFFNISSWEQKILMQAFPKDTLTFSSEDITLSNASKYKKAQILSLFVHNKLTAKILDQLPNLKLIATRSTGYDHIDLEYCKARNINVCNVPTYGENTVAEHAFALILTLSRKIVLAVNHTKQGNFNRADLQGFDLQGKTIGVVGCGNIGRHLVHMARGFNMNVLIYDLKKDPTFAKLEQAKYVSLDTLLKQSDIISLHLPYFNQTHHIINNEKLKLMKKSAILINTARGALIATDDLIQALKTKAIAGAALDVLEEEDATVEDLHLINKKSTTSQQLKTILENHILLEMPNVLITPHNAFNTQEALHRILSTTIENIKAFKNNKPKNIIVF